MIYTTEEIKRRITPIAEKYNLRTIYIFGSYARNEATETSDVDVLVDTTDSKIKGLFDMGGLYNDLCERLEKDADLVTLDALTQDGANDKTPWFTENVMKECVAVYGK